MSGSLVKNDLISFPVISVVSHHLVPFLYQDSAAMSHVPAFVRHVLFEPVVSAHHHNADVDAHK